MSSFRGGLKIVVGNTNLDIPDRLTTGDVAHNAPVHCLPSCVRQECDVNVSANGGRLPGRIKRRTRRTIQSKKATLQRARRAVDLNPYVVCLDVVAEVAQILSVCVQVPSVDGAVH